MAYSYRGRLILIALVTLTAGTLVYLIDRPVDAVPFFYQFRISTALPDIFGILGYSLPTFTHVFSFSVLTALLLGAGRNAILFSCFSWSFINLIFELGQHDALSRVLVGLFDEAAERSNLETWLAAYFKAGTFDVADVCAIIAGGMCAYIILRCCVVTKSNTRKSIVRG